MSPGRRTLVSAFAAGAVVSLCLPATAQSGEAFERQRARMVAEIADMARLTAAQTGRAEFSAAVMSAMRDVPRHRFVPASEVGSAYRNRPLPIGSGQTISQPFIVALTTDLIEPRRHHRVLEIGTGSGYQAAILAELVREVYSVEIVGALALEARERLHRLGYRNIQVKHGDGHGGWPEHAPFDAIVVTAAARQVPDALLQQLKPGGHMVIPVGSPERTQEFTLISKDAQGRVGKRVVLPVMFVPMTGGS